LSIHLYPHGPVRIDTMLINLLHQGFQVGGIDYESIPATIDVAFNWDRRLGADTVRIVGAEGFVDSVSICGQEWMERLRQGSDDEEYMRVFTRSLSLLWNTLRHASGTDWTEDQYFFEVLSEKTVPAFQSIWPHSFWVSDDVQDEIAAWLPGKVRGPWETFSDPEEEATLYGLAYDDDAVLFKLRWSDDFVEVDEIDA
jgi:hypothetical protein